MNITINADEVTVTTVGVVDPKCCGCGKSLDWQTHTVLDCLKELQKQIAELREIK